MRNTKATTPKLVQPFEEFRWHLSGTYAADALFIEQVKDIGTGVSLVLGLIERCDLDSDDVTITPLLNHHERSAMMRFAIASLQVLSSEANSLIESDNESFLKRTGASGSQE